MSPYRLAGVFFFLLVSPEPAGADPVFDARALRSTPLNPRILASNERGGIITEQVMFHSERDGDKDVEIFAFFSYPKGAKRLPAYIWNQGGLAQASPDVTQLAARRGYATLCIDFPQPGYRSTGGYPINFSLVVGADPRRAPIAHGVVALLKSVTYLESRPEVDKNRIGMAGSSWGGFFTTLMVGVDRRLKVGSAQYGTGSLQLGNAWWDGDSLNGLTPPGPDGRELWRRTLDPAWRLRDCPTPIGWFTGTNDKFYFLPAVVETYQLAAGLKHLALFPNWDHVSPPALEEQLLAWLDIHLQGKPAFLSVSPVTVSNQAGQAIARWTFTGPAPSCRGGTHCQLR